MWIGLPRLLHELLPIPPSGSIVLMSEVVEAHPQSHHHFWASAVLSFCLLFLFLASTLYHSFSMLPQGPYDDRHGSCHLPTNHDGYPRFFFVIVLLGIKYTVSFTLLILDHVGIYFLIAGECTVDEGKRCLEGNSCWRGGRKQMRCKVNLTTSLFLSAACI